MKRKRKNACPSPILDDSPKRTKVHAQRKFAQGSNVNSPVITPIRELESESPQAVALPEPVELLPIKRPNTEDFLTFLCFRGTPLLPPTLNFFNTASIVDTNGQVHEIKSETTHKNGPIDIAKCSSSNEKPFVAFGVRKRADPIVISRQMDRKRRHALALQALRRKYQEQKMAKIRALTISKLSEKVTNKTLVRTNTVSKTETITKKTNDNTLQKTKVVATKHIKVTTSTLKTTMRPKMKMKQNMCLRSFRGRFIQQELPFRKKVITNKPISSKTTKKKVIQAKKRDEDGERNSEASTSKQIKSPPVKKLIAPTHSISTRSMRSSLINSAAEIRRKQIKRILIPNSHTIIKPMQRSLRLTTLKKSILSQRQNHPLKIKPPMRTSIENSKKQENRSEQKKTVTNKGEIHKTETKTLRETINHSLESKASNKGKVVIKDYKKVSDLKELSKILDRNRRHLTRSTDNKKEINISTNFKRRNNLAVAIKRSNITDVVKKQINAKRNLPGESLRRTTRQTSSFSDKTDKKNKSKSVEKETSDDDENTSKSDGKKSKTKQVKPVEDKKEYITTDSNTSDDEIAKKTKKIIQKLDSEQDDEKTPDSKIIDNRSKKGSTKSEKIKKDSEDESDESEFDTNKSKSKTDISTKTKTKKSIDKTIEDKPSETLANEEDSDKEESKKNPLSESTDKKKRELEEVLSDEDTKKEPHLTRLRREREEIAPRSQRLSRKTKEAAAIYMELLSQKLVNDAGGDDDSISIDSFPELPNVKRTEQRENELKAKAKTTKDDKDTEESDIQEICSKKDLENDGKSRNKDIEIEENTKDSESSIKVKNDSGSKSSNKRKGANDEIVETKYRKSQETAKTPEENKPKRAMRYSSKIIECDDDSDESFHIDVKVPRKKKNTRSRVSTRAIKSLNISSSDSDQSTTSDKNFTPDLNKYKTKKFTKTKSMKKADDSYTDTDDDEPLSKRTSRTAESSQKTSVKTRNAKERAKRSPEVEIIEPKPKRECAKLPQNYLPMLSSSDEEEIFHGFDEKVETKPVETYEPPCVHAPPLLDLLNNDVDRRYGKEKVNMSNEQIEKWLKESALAGSGIRKENDEMLKFGERIPTETSLDVSHTIDTEKLKRSLLGEQKSQSKETKTDATSVSKPASVTKSVDSSKPPLDRKLIFRKSKCETANAPNVSAFSPENESSVYAFGEDNEDTISTPFRRPSRRPSSTATSKSEDESSKQDDASRTGPFRKPTSKIIKDESEPVSNPETDDNKQFYMPQNPTKTPLLKVPKTLFKSKSSEKISDADEFKYKVPSSPSASSSSSAKLYKRPTQKQKPKPAEFLAPTYVSDFPKGDEPARLVEAPVFHPTESEFQDPLEYIERIRHKAEQFGICKIVPPSSFKPECKVTDDMRFTAYNQYVNKMLYRWGPNFKEFMAIKKYLKTQSITLNHPPWIGGMEIDLPRLYQTVQSLGGLKEVIEKKKWSKVSELMKIPKSAQDRVTKLDDIYCKYLLPYDTLSPAEREKLFDEVETEWAKRESRNLIKNQEDKLDVDGDSDVDEDCEECITKGRNMALNAFYRIARNTMSMYFKVNDPTPQEVEQDYWKYVVSRDNHICVHSGSIDCGNWGYGFPVTKNSPFAKHPWNLKMLTNNTGSILRSLGPVMGVTVPTLHVGMVFSACCWYRDPHGLPWIEYLHTGGSKIWYGIPNSMGTQFHASLKNLVPGYCKNKELWLPSDTIMVPPNLLVENNVSLCRSVQEPGQFIVVFPKAFTSNISTGYVVSESVFFAPIYWIKTARALFDALKQSNEPAMFSLDRLFFSVVNDGKCSVEMVRQTLPLVQELCGEELEIRKRELGKLGELEKEKLPVVDLNKGKKKKFQQGDEGDYECEICRSSLFLSMIFDTAEGVTYCLEHAVELMEKNELKSSNCKFMFTYDDDELRGLPDKVKSLLNARLQKKVLNKFAGMPTLLGKSN
ncbi:unnamed protein product [Phyllotreta striolata]|uniref:Protein Jumonji n=1 Tax=Phyllotreta striolata TaxID=444603 RepID=A0A9N9THL5_PHYSR|nr:unnamed protein product [Phyllotreta striolata]